MGPAVPGGLFRVTLVLLGLVAIGTLGPGTAGAAHSAAGQGIGSQTTTPPDPVFPNVGNSGYDVRHYSLTLKYDHLANIFLPGTRAVITARNTLGAALSRFSLDFAGPTVTGVRVNGSDAGFWRRNGPGYRHKLVVQPATPIPRNGVFGVEVRYSGQPAEIVDPDGSPEGWLRVDTAGFEGAFVVNEPIGAMGWFPNNNTPSDKATFEFHDTVATDRSVIANGELDSRVDNGDGTWTWSWSMPRPMATYLSTSSVGNFDYSMTTGPLTGLPLYNAISNNNTAGQKAAINGVLGREDSIIHQLGTRFGVGFPFGSGGAVVDQLDGVGYVLEVQTRIHFPTRSVDAATLAHETTHQWFGDAVTGYNWHDLWLHEGWATWGESWWDSVHGAAADGPARVFRREYRRGSGSCPGTNKWCRPPSRVTGSSLFDDFPTYLRPMMMFEAQRQIMGATRFKTLIRRWLTRYRYRNAGRSQWTALTRQVDGGHRNRRWKRFFRQWLDGRTMPKINPANFGSR